jgi:DNA modification methylase
MDNTVPFAGQFTLINGNSLDVLKTFPENHFDSVVTDPP